MEPETGTGLPNGIPRPLIKVCGLLRSEDVLLCEELGVDWTGFIFHPASPRNADPKLVAALPRGKALRVGVFVDQSAEDVCRIMKEARLDLAQLHGRQDQQFCAALGRERVIRVFWPQRYAGRELLEQDLQAFASVCNWFLLDAGTSGGGHGASLNFRVLHGLNSPRPWLLAGGLGPENIRQALDRCLPDGLDLNSGVEDAPGKKSGPKLELALRLARMP
ncbi:phosphoribosylanthranilate isomerase [Desulfonatronum thiosulfatophilum]|uniref:N-(5'-phosphoribosyl)anthranilate isomerase n=1 Tax=Desulfonatronum thiosulfatophilum TaxID=617002 RepID=A0A1G6B142_9BACT|nr:phosphoribosylanthranilate isomerase [Desulfonatronum thiosulfatophilum]SDB14411.1 phosphoribosylanthranilate isomerase [Desulfonatronum thiosulfatophilum]